MPDATGVVLRGGGPLARSLPALVLASVAVVALVLGSPAGAAVYVFWAAAAMVKGFRRDDLVRLTQHGIAVTKRRRPVRLYRWDDLLEVGWGSAGFWSAGPLVRTVGGTPFEAPSPGVPSVVASLFRPTRETKDLLANACAEHGVPYSEHMQADIEKGRRRVRLPSDAERRAMLESARGELSDRHGGDVAG